ncbi:hypothetical protein [Agrobacterium rosae]|uniref:Uncharacterized protein n=1 Tax=Agrobacterium rosae TaxID=1972867 RepID=A0AAW9FKP4_9HYPH|nr:hypothetical protein [Agrobacterium rosae]MDX8304177.1 hypothetical protein [Agrobacterium rosae]
MSDKLFHFKSRWKEELAVSGSGGSFVLEMPIGVLSVYLLTEEEWVRRGPDWARSLWPILKQELEEWCHECNAELRVDPTAEVFPI